MPGGFLGKGTHQPTGLVGVLKTIKEHMVINLPMPHAITATGTVEQIGRIGHALKATGNGNVVGTGQNGVMGHHGRLHARAAHLVDRGAADRFRDTGAEGGLTCRCLPHTSGQDATHDHIIDVLAGNRGTLHRLADGIAAKCRCLNVGEITLKPTHWCPGSPDDHHRITVPVRHDEHSLLRCFLFFVFPET